MQIFTKKISLKREKGVTSEYYFLKMGEKNHNEHQFLIKAS